MKLLICGCKIIEYDNTYSSDILIENRKILKIAPNIKVEDDCEKINAEGLFASAGLIDMHCHLREPGFEYKEDIESGTKSAAMGGFTSVVCMANTKPVIDDIDTLDDILKRINEKSLVNVYPVAAITKGQKGEVLTDFGSLKKAGVKVLSDDGRPVENSSIMRSALINAKELGLCVSSHCEDISICDGVINEGEISEKLNVKGIPESAENIMIARDCLLSLQYDAPVHIQHITTKTGVDLVRYFKGKGAKVTCETCPHYFSLSEEDVLKSGALAKMNPPLRTKEDVSAIIEGLKDGTIDVIATDHAPHSKEEKELPLDNAPNGIVGFETALSIGITYLVKGGHLTINELIAKMTKNPAEILNINTGIKVGRNADIILFNPNEERVIDINTFCSKSKNSPFDGHKLNGKVYYTIVNGEVIVNNGKLSV